MTNPQPIFSCRTRSENLNSVNYLLPLALAVRHTIPYSDLTSLTDEERQRYTAKHEPLSFGHTLEDQIAGQLDAGFMLTGFYEDRDLKHPLAKYLPTFIATRALKKARP